MKTSASRITISLLLCLGLRVQGSQAAGASRETMDEIARQATEAWKVIEPQSGLAEFTASHRGNRLAWNAACILDSYIYLYEATRDGKYLAAIPKHADLIFDNRADRWGISDKLRGRVVKGWASTDYTTDHTPTCWMGHAAMILRPIIRWAYFVKADEKLRAKYGRKADQYLREAAESMLDFDSDWREGPTSGEGHYLGLYDAKYKTIRGGIQDQPIPFNYHSLAGRTFAWLWLTTGEQRFKLRAEKLGRFFKNRLRLEDNAYVWKYAVYRPDGYEDTGHSSMNVAFAVDAYRAGIVFDAQDIGRFVNCLNRWYRGPEYMPETIDGKGRAKSDHNMTRWAILAHVSPQARKVAYEYMRPRWDAASGSRFRYMEGAAHLICSGQPTQFYQPLSESAFISK